jgi:hypothetical protein
VVGSAPPPTEIKWGKVGSLAGPPASQTVDKLEPCAL